MFAYLDHASTTAVRPEAQAAFIADLNDLGNPSSLHSAGRNARRTVEEARESLASTLEVRPGDIAFTSGGTEADNLAIKGIHANRLLENPERKYVVVSAVEHHAVLDSARALVQSEGLELVLIPVNDQGVVDLEWFSEWLDANHELTSIVSVMWANNETGAVQPVAELQIITSRYGIPFHCDGVQAVAWQPAPGTWMSAGSALALSGHKIGAPIGIGALVLDQVGVKEQVHGGGQEPGRRSGTLAAGLISSFAAAAKSARDNRESDATKLAGFVSQIEDSIIGSIPDAVINSREVERLPGTLSVSFDGLESDALLMLLDASEVACSAGSACQSGIPQPSHVLLAMGIDPLLARGSIRFSVGWSTTEDEVAKGIEVLPAAVERARAAYVARHGKRNAKARARV